MAANKMLLTILAAFVTYGVVMSDDPAPTCKDAIGLCASEKGCTGDDTILKCLETAMAGACNGTADEKQIKNAILSAETICNDDVLKEIKECIQILVPCTAELDKSLGKCTEVQAKCTPKDACSITKIETFFDKLETACECIKTEKCAGPRKDSKIECTDKEPQKNDTECYDKDKCATDKDLSVYILEKLCKTELNEEYNKNMATCTWNMVYDGMQSVKNHADDKDCVERSEVKWDDKCKTLKDDMLAKGFKPEDDCNGAGQLLAPMALIILLLATLAKMF